MQWGYNLCITGARALRFNRHTTWHIKNEFALKKGEKKFFLQSISAFFMYLYGWKYKKWTIERLIIVLFFPTPSCNIPLLMNTCIANLIAQIECVQESIKKYIYRVHVNVSEKICLWNFCCWFEWLYVRILVAVKSTAKRWKEREREKVMRIECVEAHRDGHALPSSSRQFHCRLLIRFLPSIFYSWEKIFITNF